MNMLANKIPFGLLSEEEQDIFRHYVNWIEWFDGLNWKPVMNTFRGHDGDAVRLKLKEGEWYTSCSGTYKWYGEELVKEDFKFFRPSTQEEIQAVQPKELTFADIKSGERFTSNMLCSHGAPFIRIQNEDYYSVAIAHDGQDSFNIEAINLDTGGLWNVKGDTLVKRVK